MGIQMLVLNMFIFFCVHANISCFPQIMILLNAAQKQLHQ